MSTDLTDPMTSFNVRCHEKMTSPTNEKEGVTLRNVNTEINAKKISRRDIISEDDSAAFHSHDFNFNTECSRLANNSSPGPSTEASLKFDVFVRGKSQTFESNSNAREAVAPNGSDQDLRSNSERREIIDDESGMDNADNATAHERYSGLCSDDFCQSSHNDVNKRIYDVTSRTKTDFYSKTHSATSSTKKIISQTADDDVMFVALRNQDVPSRQTSSIDNSNDDIINAFKQNGGNLASDKLDAINQISSNFSTEPDLRRTFHFGATQADQSSAAAGISKPLSSRSGEPETRTNTMRGWCGLLKHRREYAAIRRVAVILQDNRMLTGNAETRRKLRRMNRTRSRRERESCRLLKRALNALFVGTGVSLLVAVVVVIFCTSIGEWRL